MAPASLVITIIIISETERQNILKLRSNNKRNLLTHKMTQETIFVMFVQLDCHTQTVLNN